MIVYVEIRSEITSWGYLLSVNSADVRTGRSRSLNHQTISEHVFGSGAITNTGSARTRHSHKLHSAGKQDAKARSGVLGGRDASIYISQEVADTHWRLRPKYWCTSSDLRHLLVRELDSDQVG